VKLQEPFPRLARFYSVLWRVEVKSKNRNAVIMGTTIEVTSCNFTFLHYLHLLRHNQANGADVRHS
jgi:hypothetical protein